MSSVPGERSFAQRDIGPSKARRYLIASFFFVVISRLHHALESSNLLGMRPKSKSSVSESAQKPAAGWSALTTRSHWWPCTNRRHRPLQWTTRCDVVHTKSGPRPVFPSKISVGSELAKLCNWHKETTTSRGALATGTRTQACSTAVSKVIGPLRTRGSTGI